MSKIAAITFRRNTHRDGKARSDLPHKASVWQRHGLIGHMLESGRPMTLEEVCAAVWAYQTQEYEPKARVSEILDGLSALVDADFAAIALPDHLEALNDGNHAGRRARV